MKWKLTLIQYQAITDVLSAFVLSMHAIKYLPPTYQLYGEILAQAKSSTQIAMIKLKAKNKKDGWFRLTQIEALTFWIVMSDAVENARQIEIESLEFNVSTEICRDIHQKLLTQ